VVFTASIFTKLTILEQHHAEIPYTIFQRSLSRVWKTW